MQLWINKSFPYDFINSFLRNKIKIYIGSMWGQDKLENIDNFLYNTLGINYSAYDILMYAIDNAEILVDTHTFKLDTEIVDEYKDTGYRIKDLLNLIEYGNLEVKGTKALSKSFNYIRNNLIILYKIYIGR